MADIRNLSGNTFVHVPFLEDTLSNRALRSNQIVSDKEIENTFGGEHEWWNMHLAKFTNEHQAGIHRTGSPANTLFKGGKK